jgi:plasmid maintenance system antidote protein VapI
LDFSDVAGPERVGAVTPGEAFLLGRRFGTPAEFWLNLQMAHDLELARREMRDAA